jgi:hypothetical protein
MRRLALTTALLALLCAIPSSAFAEKIDADRTCYIAGKHDTITITGSGFPPGKPFRAYSGDLPGPEEHDDLNLNVNGTTGADGSVSFSFPTFKLEHGGRYNPEITVSSLSDDYSTSFSAQTQIRMTSSVAGLYTFQTPRNSMDRFGVFNKPSNATKPVLGLPFGDGLTSRPKKAHYRDKVQFFGMGYGDGTVPQPTKWLFLHYVDPSGKSIRDEYLAQVRACGSATTLSGRFLFRGEKKPKPGLWKFQFDWNRKYSKNAADAKVVYAKVARSGWVTFPGNTVYDYEE